MNAISLKGIGLAALIGAALVAACDDDDSTTTTTAAGPGSSSSKSSTGSGGSTSSSSAGPGGAGGGMNIDCATYCGLMKTNCIAENQQYLDDANCAAVCAVFEPGNEIGATADNTLGCRIYHATAAGSMDADLHCRHAGPMGADQCGSNCEGFCTINVQLCTGNLEQYSDEPTCVTTCEAYTDDEPFDIADTAGNTLACRMYHLLNAQATPDPHCNHTGMTPADNQCSNP